MCRSLVIDHLKDAISMRKAGLAHFYFNYQDRRKQSAELVLASLLRQLAMLKTELPTPILELRRKMESQQRDFQQHDLEQAILFMCADFDQIFIVIDALDECDNDYRKDLLLVLARLKKNSSVRICLTSRPHTGQEIARKLGAPLRVEIGATDSDLKVYLSSKIDDSDNIDIIDEEFKEEIISKVIQAAQKMFVPLSECAIPMFWVSSLILAYMLCRLYLT